MNTTCSRNYYDNYWNGVTGWQPTNEADAEFKSWMERVVRPGQSVLDVGCGDGAHYAQYLIEAGIRLQGVDVSEVAVREARKRGVDATCASLDTQLPYEDRQFDAAICIEVLEHLFDPELAASEIYRVLRPGGRLLITVPNIANWRCRVELLIMGNFGPGGSPVTSRRYPWRDPHIRFFNHRALRDMLEEVGFVIEKQGGIATQFLDCAPGLRHLPKSSPALDKGLRWFGRRFYRLLAARCVIIARKPEG